MKKINNKGFILAETLIVTVFVASILIFLYIQFSNLNKSYDESFIYNSVEGLYALEDVKYYIESDSNFLEYIDENIELNKYLEIKNCAYFTDKNYCSKLFEVENIIDIIITYNSVPYGDIENFFREDFLKFVSKINKEGNEKYRIIASFENGMYATVRFGD